MGKKKRSGSKSVANASNSNRRSEGSTEAQAGSPPLYSGFGAKNLDAQAASDEAIAKFKCVDTWFIQTHWRYIASFHGPWLQLKSEVLDDLAHNNYFARRPRPIDHGILFDYAKIRKLVEEASGLAIQATDGTSASAPNNRKTHGGSHMKVSRERQRRMREIAVSKLYQAYCIDEIAASVAAMQHASTLDELPELVLQRNSTNLEAKYINLFHEKVPTRLVSENSSIELLNEIISQRPSELGQVRTRAITSMFQQKLQNALADWDEGLRVCKARNLHLKYHHEPADYGHTKNFLSQTMGRDWRNAPERKLSDEEQPSTMECQMFFQRACANLSLAIQNIYDALVVPDKFYDAYVEGRRLAGAVDQPPPGQSDDKEAAQKRTEACKAVKMYARRALRDLTCFLSRFDYMRGVAPDVSTALLGQVGLGIAEEEDDQDAEDDVNASEHAAKAGPAGDNTKTTLATEDEDKADTWAPRLHTKKLSTLFASDHIKRINSRLKAVARESNKEGVPESLSDNVLNKIQLLRDADNLLDELYSFVAVTYHPLIPDALHSLLLCHSLLQTPAKEIRRHAYNVARIIRVCDGYPFFHAARSPSRGDWLELLRLSNNFVGLDHPWSTLCARSALPENHPFRTYPDLLGGNDNTPNNEAFHLRQNFRRKAIMSVFGNEDIKDAEGLVKFVNDSVEESINEYLRTHPDDGHPAHEELADKQGWVPEDPDIKDLCMDGERGAVLACWVCDGPEPSSIEEEGNDGGASRGHKKKGPMKRLPTSRYGYGVAALIPDPPGYVVPGRSHRVKAKKNQQAEFPVNHVFNQFMSFAKLKGKGKAGAQPEASSATDSARNAFEALTTRDDEV